MIRKGLVLADAGMDSTFPRPGNCEQRSAAKMHDWLRPSQGIVVATEQVFEGKCGVLPGKLGWDKLVRQHEGETLPSGPRVVNSNACKGYLDTLHEWKT